MQELDPHIYQIVWWTHRCYKGYWFHRFGIFCSQRQCNYTAHWMCNQMKRIQLKWADNRFLNHFQMIFQCVKAVPWFRAPSKSQEVYCKQPVLLLYWFREIWEHNFCPKWGWREKPMKKNHILSWLSVTVLYIGCQIYDGNTKRVMLSWRCSKIKTKFIGSVFVNLKKFNPESLISLEYG